MKLRHLAGILLLICSLHTCKKFEPSHYLLVRTEDVSDISFTTVKFNGLLLDVPEEEVSEHGFCWSVNSVPEVDTDSSVLMGAVNEAGEFSRAAGGLFSNTSYCVRAFATYNGGTVYGEEMTFTTLVGVPENLTQMTYGGSLLDHARSMIPTSDGGYAVAGYSNSVDGDVSEPHNDLDFWVLKLSAGGDLLWQKSLVSSGEDRARAIIQTQDGGYAIAGDSYSDEMSYDFKVARLSMNGDVQWEKSYGGSDYDVAHSIIQCADGCLVIAGYSESSDGDVTNNQGHQDCWIIKLDSDGELLWQRSMGGSEADEAFAIILAQDGGYMVAGQTYSSDGDVTGQHGNSDVWITKLNENGYIQWQKTLGGSGHEAAKSLIVTLDGGYAVTGLTYSSDGDVSALNGDCDYWIVRLDSDGNILWDRSLGGSKRDDARFACQTADRGFVVAGSTFSGDGDITEPLGGSDCWIVKLNISGDLQWQKTWGGSGDDHAYSVLQTPGEDAYILAGETSSNDGHVTGNHGEWDYWVAFIKY